MKLDRSGRRDGGKGIAPSRVARIPSAITSRHAALRREQIVAARLLAESEVERGVRPHATRRIAAARDRRSPFVWRAPRRGR